MLHMVRWPCGHMAMWPYGHMQKNMAKWGIPGQSIKNDFAATHNLKIEVCHIWFVWSKASYSGDKRRCHYAGRTDGQTNEQLKIELLSQWKLEAESRN